MGQYIHNIEVEGPNYSRPIKIPLRVTIDEGCGCVLISNTAGPMGRQSTVSIPLPYKKPEPKPEPPKKRGVVVDLTAQAAKVYLDGEDVSLIVVPESLVITCRKHDRHLKVTLQRYDRTETFETRQFEVKTDQTPRIYDTGTNTLIGRITFDGKTLHEAALNNPWK